MIYMPLYNENNQATYWYSSMKLLPWITWYKESILHCSDLKSAQKIKTYQ